MKLFKINRESPTATSFTVSETKEPHFLKTWHYHPELELVYILESSGTRFIGNSIAKFKAGELVLLGANLPHMWLNDTIYFDHNSSLKAKAIAVHFTEDFLGKDFFSVSEMTSIAKLLARAKRGVLFKNINPSIIKRLQNLRKLSPFERTVGMLLVLQELTMAQQELINSEGYLISQNLDSNNRFSIVYEYVFKNFRDPIKLSEVASLIPMNPSSFSRLFSRFHKKSFIRYLNEIRIGYACKMLVDQSNSISETCYSSGFNNLSNFNRQFKIITGKSPSEYAKNYTEATD